MTRCLSEASTRRKRARRKRGAVSVLIEAHELAALLGSHRAPVVADVRWSLGGPPGLPQFEAAHIPGAQWVDLERELSSPPGKGGRHPLAPVDVFQAAMRRIGVAADASVVVCDGGNAVAAARLWWMLTDAGHDDVRVLNGGVAAWQAAGFGVERGPARAVAAGDFTAVPGKRSQVAGEEVAAALGDPMSPVIVDVRAAERYSGATEPMDPVAGHIPGAINLPSMDNIDAHGKFIAPAELTARYTAARVGRSPIVYCGSGITAAHTLLALEQAGVPDATLYVGSWSDWVTDPSRPVATGDTP
ncbi:MAG: sulfurtransferase [Propionibacteriaceae bacterium]|nr:sulfurtransferase [Propionibacteriaceae bacterium]